MKETKAILKKVCEVIEDKKGEDVTILDISEVSSFTDFFIICHGFNDRQNRVLCDEIVQRLKKEERVTPTHLEGYQHAEWILMDYLDFVIHIFSSQSREFYQLEKLWSDGVKVKRKALSA